MTSIDPALNIPLQVQRQQHSLKIKIIKQNVIIALRCNPNTIRFDSLVNWIYERLYEGNRPGIKVKERYSRATIEDDESLKTMIEENPEKMVLFVNDIQLPFEEDLLILR